MTNSNENNVNSLEIEKDLQNELKQIDSKLEAEIPNDKIELAPIKKFICSDYLLDLFQGLPVYIQKEILCRDLNSEQKKLVNDILKANDDETQINRRMIKFLIEKLCTKYPTLEKVFSEEIYYLGHFVLSMHQKNEMIKERLASQASAKCL